MHLDKPPSVFQIVGADVMDLLKTAAENKHV